MTQLKLLLTNPDWLVDLDCSCTFFDDTVISSSKEPISLLIGNIVLSWDGSTWSSYNITKPGKLSSIPDTPNRFIMSKYFTSDKPPLYSADEIDKYKFGIEFNKLPNSKYKVSYVPEICLMRGDKESSPTSFFSDLRNDVELALLSEKFDSISQTSKLISTSICFWKNLLEKNVRLFSHELDNNLLSTVNFFNFPKQELISHLSYTGGVGVRGVGIYVLDQDIAEKIYELNGGSDGINKIISELKVRFSEIHKTRLSIMKEFKVKAEKYAIPLLTQQEYLSAKNIIPIQPEDLDPYFLPDWNMSDFNAIVINPGANQEGNTWHRVDYDANPEIIKGGRKYYPNKDWQFSVVVDTSGKIWRYLPIPDWVRASYNGQDYEVCGPHVYRYKPLKDKSYFDFKQKKIRIGRAFFTTELLMCRFSAEIRFDSRSNMEYRIEDHGESSWGKIYKNGELHKN